MSIHQAVNAGQQNIKKLPEKPGENKNIGPHVETAAL